MARECGALAPSGMTMRAMALASRQGPSGHNFQQVAAIPGRSGYHSSRLFAQNPNAFVERFVAARYDGNPCAFLPDAFGAADRDADRGGEFGDVVPEIR